MTGMIRVHTQYQSRFREITGIPGETFELEQPLVSELAWKIAGKYGDRMESLLIDRETNELNERGTMYVDSKGRRVYMEDQLTDGETIAFLIGIAGG
jgi:molybdopterin converting factor small subunit